MSNDLTAACYEQDRNEHRIANWHAKGGPRLRQAEIDARDWRRDQMSAAHIARNAAHYTRQLRDVLADLDRLRAAGF